MNTRSTRARTPLRKQLRAAVENAILDAAEAEIAERGLPAASLTAIAARAGIAVGTLYNYHRDRDELIRALFTRGRAILIPRITALIAAGAGQPFEPRLRTFVREVLALFDEHRRFVKVAIEADHLKPRLSRGARTPGPTLDTLQEGLRTVLDVGVAEGTITVPRRDLAVRLLTHMLRGEVRHHLDGDVAFAAQADLIVDHFLLGIGAAGPSYRRPR